jgi:GNAT superfamily N-acetyltransferase
MVPEDSGGDPAGIGGWRPMRPEDLAACEAIGNGVHAAHPEGPAVMAERLRLFPEGCRVLVAGAAVLGYAVLHPWLAGRPPALDTLLGALPPHPDALHLHDLTLLPRARGAGAGAEAVAFAAALALRHRLPRLTLVSVGGAGAFWRRHGFRGATGSGVGAALCSYGADAAYMDRAA